MATPNEPAIILLSLVVCVFSLVALSVGATLSLPAAIRRLRRYPNRSAHRSFALRELTITLSTLTALFLFFTAGLDMLLVVDEVWRMAYVRLSMVFAILILCAVVVVNPFWANALEAQSLEEYEELRRKANPDGERAEEGE